MESERPIVLITGSGGRIGTAISAALGDAYRVVGLERKCGDEPDCITVDVTSDERMTEAFAEFRARYGSRIASVIHLAAYFDFSGEPNPLYGTVNVEGTRRLLRHLRDFDVEQFVYASSMLVHAPTEPGVPITEESPIDPKWAYPESKAQAERVVREEHGPIPSAILRIAGVYTDQCDVPALAYQIQRIYERQWLSHLFPGDSSHGQAFVHLEDVADAFRRLVDRRAALPPETTLLIGEPEVVSYAELQNLIGESLYGQGWVTREIPKPVAAGGSWAQDKLETVIPDSLDQGIKPFIRPFMIALADDHYELDVHRAETLLDWHPKHRLRDRLPRMLETLRRDPLGWYRHNRIPVRPWLEEAEALPDRAGRTVMAHDARARKAHARTLWCHFANLGLGLWLMASPFLLGLAQHWMEPTPIITPTGRGLAYSHTFMTANAVIVGLLIAVLALVSMSREKGWARWTVAAFGIWLLFAPLVFWTPSAAAYLNDTLVGILAITFAVAIPPAPGVTVAGWMTESDIPPGWDYNPSGWYQRIPIVLLALAGFIISRYLAAYQLGHIDAAWDPFFGGGTEQIITSWASEAWPVADAGLGATVYALEIATGAIGDRRRWRTVPWVVLLFGFLIVPLGGTSLIFILIQPVLLGTWCTLCLIGATAVLLQIPYAVDEVLATLQYLRARRRAGTPLLRTLLYGGASDEGKTDRSDDFERPAREVVREALTTGLSVPWNLAAMAAVGALLMLTRLLFGTEGAGADSDHLVGALAFTFAVLAFAEIARPLRFGGALLGAWAVLAPFLLGGYSLGGAAFTLLAGIALILLSLPRGRIVHRYGEWSRSIR